MRKRIAIALIVAAVVIASAGGAIILFSRQETPKMQVAEVAETIKVDEAAEIKYQAEQAAKIEAERKAEEARKAAEAKVKVAAERQAAAAQKAREAEAAKQARIAAAREQCKTDVACKNIDSFCSAIYGYITGTINRLDGDAVGSLVTIGGGKPFSELPEYTRQGFTDNWWNRTCVLRSPYGATIGPI